MVCVFILCIWLAFMDFFRNNIGKVLLASCQVKWDISKGSFLWFMALRAVLRETPTYGVLYAHQIPPPDSARGRPLFPTTLLLARVLYLPPHTLTWTWNYFNTSWLFESAILLWYYLFKPINKKDSWQRLGLFLLSSLWCMCFPDCRWEGCVGSWTDTVTHGAESQREPREGIHGAPGLAPLANTRVPALLSPGWAARPPQGAPTLTFHHVSPTPLMHTHAHTWHC